MNTTITPPKKKRNVGQQPADDNHHQTKILGFRIGEGSHSCWNSYAENLHLTGTELFYRMMDHLASQGNFITWFEQNQPDQVAKNPEWIESWKMVSKCAENMLMLNKGRKKQVEEKPIEEKISRMVREELDKYYIKEAKKLYNE